MKRECYTLCGSEGQTEKTLCIRGRDPSEVERMHAASRRDLGERMCNPRGLVPFSPEGNRCEIRRIRLYEQTILWNQSYQVVVRPFVESDDAAERDVPSRVQGELRQRMGARVAMKDSGDASGSGIADDGASVVFRISRVDDDGLAHLGGERNLSRERGALGFAWGIVVVIVEPALADRDGRTVDQRSKLRKVA